MLWSQSHSPGESKTVGKLKQFVSLEAQGMFHHFECKRNKGAHTCLVTKCSAFITLFCFVFGFWFWGFFLTQKQPRICKTDTQCKHTTQRERIIRCHGDRYTWTWWAWMSRYAFGGKKKQVGDMASSSSFQMKYQYALFSTCFGHISISKEYFSRLAGLKLQARLSITKLLKRPSFTEENLPSWGSHNKMYFFFFIKDTTETVFWFSTFMMNTCFHF